MAGLVHVRDHRELTAVVVGFARLPNTIRREINNQTRRHLNPIWQGEIRSNVRTKMDDRIVAKGARVKAGNPPVLTAAKSTRAIGGRLRPAEDWHAWEFGSTRQEEFTRYWSHSPKGTRYAVTRRTSKGLPARTRSGRVAYPALAGTVPRAAALWVQTVYRAVAEAAEGSDG